MQIKWFATKEILNDSQVNYKPNNQMDSRFVNIFFAQDFFSLLAKVARVQNIPKIEKKQIKSIKRIAVPQRSLLSYRMSCTTSKIQSPFKYIINNWNIQCREFCAKQCVRMGISPTKIPSQLIPNLLLSSSCAHKHSHTHSFEINRFKLITISGTLDGGDIRRIYTQHSQRISLNTTMAQTATQLDQPRNISVDK